MYVVGSAEGRYLVDGDGLVGAAGDDPLVAELSGALGGSADGAHRRVANADRLAAIIPRMPSRAERLRTAGACVASGVALCLSLPPFGFWPLAIVGLVGLDRLIADQPAGRRFASRLARRHGLLRAVAELDDRARRPLAT